MPRIDRDTALVGAIVVLALVLRAANLAWGVPLDPFTGYHHPDERKIVAGAVAFPGDILTRTDLRYPTGFHYAVGLAALPLRTALGLAAPGADPFLWVFMLARGATVALGVLAVALAYALGRRWYGPAAGLTAAAFMAVTPVLVIHGAWATLDVPSACLMLVALWRCDVVMERPGRRNTALLALASGLLVGVKYPGGAIVVPALLALAIGRRRADPEGGWRRAILRGDAPAYLALTALVGLATTPSIALHPDALVAAIRYESDRQGLAALSALEPDLLADVYGGLATVAGRAAGTLFALGAAAALFRPGRREVVLLAALVPFYLALGDRAGGRYLILVLPVYALLAGRLVASVLGADGMPLWARRAVAATVAGLWLAAAGDMAGAMRLHHQPDARTEAAWYLAEHAAPGATVCIAQPSEAYPQAWKNPRVDEGRFELVGCEVHPVWVLVSGGGESRVERALASPHLGAGFTWAEGEADAWPDGRVPDPPVLRFYEALFDGRDGARDYERVAVFENDELPIAPFQVSRVGVYRARVETSR